MAYVDSELYQALDVVFGASTSAALVTDESTILYANANWLDLFGFESADEVLGRPFIERVAPSAQPMVVELVRRLVAGEEVPSAFRSRGVRADGTEVSVESSTVTFHHGDARCYVVIQREIEDEPVSLAAGQEFYKGVFNVNTAIKLLIDPNGGSIVDANQAAIDFYGWPIETLRSMSITDINQLSTSEVQEEMQRAHTGRRKYFRFRHKIASGQIRHVEVYSGPIRVGDRHLLFSIIHDVTERNALAAQLRASRHLEAVGRLAGGIAHEFNNLLTVVLNGSAMLQRKMDSDSNLRTYVEDMSYASERAADLTRDLLAFSRRQVLAPQSVMLNDVVERMIGMLQRSIGNACEIKTALERVLPDTRTDPRQLEHVLMNLVLNARDAMPNGGQIRVRTKLREVGADDAGTVPAGRWVSLSVSDDGEGMDKETQSRIFEPFFTTKAERRGTGLGMATVYGIVTQSGGHFQIESAPGDGTTIEILLPVAQRPSDSRDASPEATRDTPTATVLLVDDADHVRRSLARGLESLGFVVFAADSAESAERLFEARGAVIDALVTDIVMPGASGLELAQALHQKRPDLPVLVISGDLTGHDLTVLPGDSRQLQKPVTARRIAEELTPLLLQQRFDHSSE
jgi:PAS domain S-box-containing protein